jgi:hypothetical protein
MQTARGQTPLPSETEVRLDNVRTLRSPLHPLPRESEGIQVKEEELSSATAQCMFRMRCECGRSWFELELKILVKCPACARLNRVHIA